MRFHHIIWVSAALLATVLPANVANADAGLLANLERSRNALLRQRGDLQDASARIDSQMDELQRQRARIDAYLRDTDSALRNVEAALRASN